MGEPAILRRQHAERILYQYSSTSRVGESVANRVLRAINGSLCYTQTLVGLSRKRALNQYIYGGMSRLLSKSSPPGFAYRQSPLNSRLAAALVLVFVLFVSTAVAPGAQQKGRKQPLPQDTSRKDDGKVPNEKEMEKAKKQEETKATQVKLTQAETAIELAIIAYGGRKQLETARASIQEAGTIRLATDQGDLSGNYLLRSMRKEKSSKDLVRVDLELSPAENAQGPIKYVIGFNGASVWSAQNGQYVNPRAGADIAFRAQLGHEYMSLLRYKEDGSKLDYV